MHAELLQAYVESSSYDVKSLLLAQPALLTHLVDQLPNNRSAGERRRKAITTVVAKVLSGNLEAVARMVRVLPHQRLSACCCMSIGQ